MIEVRLVRGDEAERLRELRLRAVTDAPAAFDTTVQHEAAQPDAHWSQLAGQSELADAMVVFVAVDGERWVAMAAGRWFDRERGIASLWGMWVDPAARRLGLGDRLVGEVRRWAASHGAGFLRLGVVAGVDDAAAFYERLGFVRTGEIKPLMRDETLTAELLVRPI